MCVFICIYTYTKTDPCTVRRVCRPDISQIRSYANSHCLGNIQNGSSGRINTRCFYRSPITWVILCFINFSMHDSLFTSAAIDSLWDFKRILDKWFFKLALHVPIDGRSISAEIVLRWMPMDLNDGKSVLVHVIAWCNLLLSFNRNSYIFIQENAFENVLKMAAVCFGLNV